MEKKRAHLLLESLQENTYRRLGRLEEFRQRNHGITSKVEKNFESILDEISLTTPPEEILIIRKELLRKLYSETFEYLALELPTKYEERQTYSLLLNLCGEIETAALKLGHDVPVNIPIGTLPTGQVNAVTLRVSDNGEYLILFDSGLTTFALLLSKAVARSFPIGENRSDGWKTVQIDKDSWKKNIDENPEILKRFQEVIIAYLFDGNPGYAPQYNPEEPWGKLAGILRDSMELFIIGHEYGHIIEGHLEPNLQDIKPIFSELSEDVGVSSILRSWDMEFRADLRGSELSIAASQKQGNTFSLSYWGADFFFSCLDVIERGLSIARTGHERRDAVSETHPPTNTRRQLLRSFIKNQAENEWEQERFDAAIELGSTVEQIVEYLWEETKPLLLKFHNEGKQLSPIWDGTELKYSSETSINTSELPAEE